MADPYQAGQVLGTALFGNTQDTYTNQLGRQYQVEQALQQARQARSKAILANQINEQRALVNPDLVSGVLGGDEGARATLGSISLLANDNFDAGQLSDVLGAASRSGARDAALGGDWAGANANLMAVANGPQELAAVQGQNLINNRFREGGGGISTTEQGRAGIGADAARAAASYASANSSNASAARTRQGMALDRDSVLGSGATRGGGGKAPSGYRWRTDGSLEAIPGGPADKGGGPLGGPAKLTEGQGKDVVYYTRGSQANKLLDSMDMNLSTLGGQQGRARGLADTAIRNLPFGLGDGSLGNAAVSPQRQQAEQAGLEFLSAILRKDTGAAITPAEIDIYGKTYLPRLGDSPEVLKQKRQSRETALAAIESGLGSAAAAIPDLSNRDVLGSRQAGSRVQPPPGLPSAPASTAPLQRARNPRTGQVLVLRNGQWVPE